MPPIFLLCRPMTPSGIRSTFGCRIPLATGFAIFRHAIVPFHAVTMPRACFFRAISTWGRQTAAPEFWRSSRIFFGGMTYSGMVEVPCLQVMQVFAKHDGKRLKCSLKQPHCLRHHSTRPLNPLAYGRGSVAFPDLKVLDAHHYPGDGRQDQRPERQFIGQVQGADPGDGGESKLRLMAPALIL